MFIDFSIKDLIDILLVAYLLYQTYRLMKDSGFYQYLHRYPGIYRYLADCISGFWKMKLLGSIFDKLVSVGVLALIILFQDDIRRFLVTLGSHKQLGRFFPLPDGKQAGKDGKSGYYADCTCLYEHEQREGGGTDCHRKKCTSE